MLKGKEKFSKHNSLGASIGQDMKNCDKNSEKREKVNDDDKYKESSGKKKIMTINNSILYDIILD